MSNADTLRNFLDIINNPANANYQDEVYLVDSCFSGDNPAENPTIPCAGITDHGPAFHGRDEVKKLFSNLFSSFDSMRWLTPPPTAPGAPQLTAANNIGIQLTATGQYKRQWFQKPNDGSTDHSSAPLSQLPNDPHGGFLGRFRGDVSGLPAFAVFTFDASNLIQQLQVYTDRYALMMSITKKKWDPEAKPAHNPVGGTMPFIATQNRRLTITIEE